MWVYYEVLKTEFPRESRVQLSKTDPLFYVHHLIRQLVFEP